MAAERHRAGRAGRLTFEQDESRLRRFKSNAQVVVEPFRDFFVARTRVAIWLRNQTTRALGTGPAARMFSDRSLREDPELRDYGMPCGRACRRHRDCLVQPVRLRAPKNSITLPSRLCPLTGKLHSFSPSGRCWPRPAGRAHCRVARLRPFEGRPVCSHGEDRAATPPPHARTQYRTVFISSWHSSLLMMSLLGSGCVIGVEPA